MSLTAPLLFIISLLSIFFSQGPDVKKEIRLEGRAQGTTWHITYYAERATITKSQVDSVFEVIDSSLSLYKDYSEIVAFNKSERGIRIGPHFNNVVRKSLQVWRETGGLSDITVAPFVEAWGFGASGRRSSAPDDSLLNAMKPCVGSALIHLRNDSLIKAKSCVTIDVNGIAQGYTVDVLAAFFESASISDYVVEVGGELRIHGQKPGNAPFRIGIEAPSAAGDSEMIEKIIVPENGAVTTSGNYRKFYETGGKKLSHLIDPGTGRPCDNELISVSVFSKDAITADAFDNALMLMGLTKAMRFVEARKDLGAFFIYRQKNGTIADTASRSFRKFFQVPAVGRR